MGSAQVAKLLARSCGSALDPRFRIGNSSAKEVQTGNEGVEVTVREQQRRRMKHENGAGEMESCDMRTAHTSSHACTRCLYATQGKCVRKMWRCDTECLYKFALSTSNATTRFAPLRDPWFRGECSGFAQRRSLQQRGLLFVRSGFTPQLTTLARDHSSPWTKRHSSIIRSLLVDMSACTAKVQS